MHLRHLISLCLLSISLVAFLPGRSLVQTDTTRIRGIKVFSSHFDPSTETATLDFMNDSAFNITAWGYCVKTEKLKSEDPAHGGCQQTDTLPMVVERQVTEQLTRKRVTWDCPDCHVIHPGEHKIISVDFSSARVAAAVIDMKLVVYANGKIETNGSIGLGMEQRLAKQRQSALTTLKELLDMGDSILRNRSDEHPATTMLEELRTKASADPRYDGLFVKFKLPGMSTSDSSEATFKDERGYLQNFVTERKLQVAEFAKNQLAEVNQ